jgi:hypothetical protein
MRKYRKISKKGKKTIILEIRKNVSFSKPNRFTVRIRKNTGVLLSLARILIKLRVLAKK